MARPKNNALTLVNEEKEKSAALIETHLSASIANQETQRAAERIGVLKGINAVQRMFAAVIDSQKLRAIQLFCSDRRNLDAYGCTSVDQFLDTHGPEIGITRHEYWNRIKLLESESDQLYDALNVLGVPMNARKLLTGSVSLSPDGDAFVIGDKTIPLEDKAELLATISALHRERVKDKQTIETGKEQVKNLRQRIDELEEKGTPGRNKVQRTELEMAAIALATVITDFNRAYDDAPVKDRRRVWTHHGGTLEHLLKAAISRLPQTVDTGVFEGVAVNPDALDDDDDLERG
jgi:hypothetical protein